MFFVEQSVGKLSESEEGAAKYSSVWTGNRVL